MNVPGSPSSMLTAISRGAGSRAHDLPFAARRESRRRRGRAARSSRARRSPTRRVRSPLAHADQRAIAAVARGTRRGRCSPCTTALGTPRAHRVLDASAASRGRSDCRPTTAAGACSQRPMHGAPITRTSAVAAFVSAARSASRAGHLARQRFADAHGDRRRRRFAFLHDVEVVIERRDLVDLGLREAHLLRQRGEVRRRQVAVARPGSGAGVRSAGRDGAARRRAARARRASARGSTARPFGPLRSLRRPASREMSTATGSLNAAGPPCPAAPMTLIRGSRNAFRRTRRDRASAGAPVARQARCRVFPAPR